MLTFEFKYPTSGQRISIQTVEDWERANEIFCKMKICPVKTRQKMVSLKKPLKLELFLLFQKVKIARERKVQSINRCIIPREN